MSANHVDQHRVHLHWRVDRHLPVHRLEVGERVIFAVERLSDVVVGWRQLGVVLAEQAEWSELATLPNTLDPVKDSDISRLPTGENRSRSA